MDDLVTWLRAQLALDTEAIAEHPDGEDDVWMAGLQAETEQNYPCSQYLRISKARALREVAAKRAIVDLHPRHVDDVDGTPDTCGACFVDLYAPTFEPWPCLTLRHLAAVYADRSGYKSEWAP
jgi:hypothetical protein